MTVKKNLLDKIIIFLSAGASTISMVFYLINKKVDNYVTQKL